VTLSFTPLCICVPFSGTKSHKKADERLVTLVNYIRFVQSQKNSVISLDDRYKNIPGM